MSSKYLVVLLMVLYSVCSTAQDEHFSQFYAIPIHMNPALTGAYDGTYRMTAIYRDQWNNKLDAPYQTFAAGGDTNIDLKIGRQRSADKLGIGLFFTNDKVAEFQSNNNKLAAFAAYHKRLGETKPSYLGAGVQLGIIQHNINYDNLTFEDQFDQISTYDLQTSENLPPNNFGTFDISVGLNYSIQLEKSAFYLGAAIHHINEPSYSFFSKLSLPNPSIDISQKLERKTLLHLSLDRQLNYSTQIQPRVIYQKQGVRNQIDLGSNIEHTFKDRENALILGLWLTFQDDLDGSHIENLTPLIGLRKEKFIFGFSYDIHLLDIGQSTFGYNTFEFSIRFSGIHENTNSFCPTF